MKSYSLSLTITANDTSRISEVLGLAAHPSPNRNPKHQARNWRHFFVRETECEIEEEIAKALERCRRFQEDFWEWTAAGAYLELFVGVFADENVSFGLRPEILSQAADLGLNLGFDFYPESDASS